MQLYSSLELCFIRDQCSSTYDASANLGQFVALGVAAADGKTCETNVAGHSSKEVGYTRGNLVQLLSFLGVGKDGNVLGEQPSENEQEDTWDLEGTVTTS